MSKDKPVWYAPDDSTPRHACPCCDYVTLPERGGFLICKVYFWLRLLKKSDRRRLGATIESKVRSW